MSESGYGLEQKLIELRRLDSLREAATKLRAKGLKGIADPHSYLESRGIPPESSGRTKNGKSQTSWWPPGDLVEVALILYALRDGPKVPRELNSRAVEGLGLDELFKTGDPHVRREDNVPVLKAATSLEALSSSRNFVLSHGSLNSYFRIVYAINAARWDQLQGGVTSGAEHAPQTAFMTWRCVRAIEAFAKAFESTAECILTVANLERHRSSAAHELWSQVHHENREDWARISIARLAPTLFVPGPDSDKMSIQKSLKAICEATATPVAYLSEFHEASTPQRNEFMSSATATQRAYEAINDLLSQLDRIGSAVSAPEGPSIAVDSLMNVAKSVRGQLQPTYGYFRSVLDHELVSSTIHRERVTDVAELVFAAAGASRVSATDPQAMDQQTMTAALDKAVTLMTNNGRVPSHKPFDVGPKGYVLNAAAAEILHAFAELAARIEFPVTVETAQRMLNHFNETWRDDESHQGWRHERDNPTARCHWWLSAISVEALQLFARMLDKRINQIVFADLHVIDPRTTSLKMSDLFYPDYGMVVARADGRIGVAKTLSKLLAHLLGTSLPGEPLYSAILFGPPGTGKTTLVEALARSANLPMVEITPSDIVLGGEAQIETRARALFEALAMVTDTVILFDEFDRVLKNRNQAGDRASIFQFLTPGMLPKLKTLHDRVKKQRSAFILSTNLIGSLDPAAVREGRFDTKIGVYPPDVLSRAGRLDEAMEATVVNKEEFTKRRHRVIDASAGRGMTSLAKPGWFTGNVGKPPAAGTPLRYLSAMEEEEPRFPEPEKKLPKTPKADYQTDKADAEYPSDMAKVEWKEWYFVVLMDKQAEEPTWLNIDTDFKAQLRSTWNFVSSREKDGELVGDDEAVKAALTALKEFQKQKGKHA